MGSGVLSHPAAITQLTGYSASQSPINTSFLFVFGYLTISENTFNKRKHFYSS